MQGSGLHVVSQQDAGLAAAATAADRLQLLAQDQQSDQQAHAQSGDTGEAVKRSSTLFGAKGGVKLANGEQAAALAALGTAAHPAGRVTHTHASTHASGKVAAAHRAAVASRSRGGTGTLVSSLEGRPEPPVVELTDDEVARWV